MLGDVSVKKQIVFATDPISNPAHLSTLNWVHIICLSLKFLSLFWHARND